MQLYAGIYLLQNHSTYFGCPSHPSLGVHKSVIAASGTDTMTCTWDWNYSFMYSWWWVRWTPETFRV